MLRSRFCAPHVGFLIKGTVQIESQVQEVRQMWFYKKSFVPAIVNFVLQSHMQITIDHAMIVGDWS